LNLSKIMMDSISIKGSRGSGGWACKRVLRYLASGSLKMDFLVSDRFPLEQINAAFAAFVENSSRAFRMVINP